MADFCVTMRLKLKKTAGNQGKRGSEQKQQMTRTQSLRFVVVWLYAHHRLIIAVSVMFEIPQKDITYLLYQSCLIFHRSQLVLTATGLFDQQVCSRSLSCNYLVDIILTASMVKEKPAAKVLCTCGCRKMMSARNVLRHLKGQAPVNIRASVLAMDDSNVRHSRPKRPRIQHPNQPPASQLEVSLQSSVTSSPPPPPSDELTMDAPLFPSIPVAVSATPTVTADIALAAVEHRVWAGRTRTTVEEVGEDEDEDSDESVGKSDDEGSGEDMVGADVEDVDNEFEVISEWDRIMESVQRDIAKTSGAFRVLSRNFP